MHLQGLFDLLWSSVNVSLMSTGKKPPGTEQTAIRTVQAGADETTQVLSCVLTLFFLLAKSGRRRVCGQSSRRWSLAAVAWQWKK